MKIYAHRNGETALPTEPGRYWFRGTCGISEEVANVIEVTITGGKNGGLMAWSPNWSGGWHEDIEEFSGQWWGPLVPPWETGA